MNQNPVKPLDKEALEHLFKSQFKGLCLVALRYTKDHDAAKEIVQDAFIGLWERRMTIDLSRQVHSYLATMVRNKSLNYLRDNKKFNSDILDMEEISMETVHYQSDRLVETEIRNKINEAIGKLPEKCRQIFLLSRDERLKYQEIADHLSISVKTVESQMSKALQHMRVSLAEFLPALIIVFMKSNGF